MSQATVLLQEKAYKYIKEKIQAGKYDKTSVLSLNDIAKDLEMSKTPVRDAVQRLSKEGLIEILPSRGIRIVQYTPHEIVELFQTRYAISDFCCTMLALKHREDPTLPIFKQIEDVLLEQEATQDKDFETYYDTDWKFHMLLVDGLNNRYFHDILENRKDVYSSFAKNCVPHVDTIAASIAEHRSIYEGICNGNVTQCRIASHSHLTRTLRANLAEVEGIDEFISKLIPIELIKVD